MYVGDFILQISSIIHPKSLATEVYNLQICTIKLCDQENRK